MARKCSRCSRDLNPGDQAYCLQISVMSDFDGVILQEGSSTAQALLEEIRRRTEGVPADLLEEEIHREFSFLLCPECKGRYCANPLNLPLKGIIFPETIPEPEDG